MLIILIYKTIRISTKSILYNSKIYAIGDFFSRIISFALFPLYTHFLVPKSFGEYTYIVSFLPFLFTLGSMGINSYYLRNYGFLKTQNQKNELFGKATYVLLLLNLIVLLILGFVLFYYRLMLSIENIFFLIVNSFLNNLSIMPLAKFRLLQKAKLFTWLQISRTVLQVILTIIFLVIFEMGVRGILLSILISNFIFAIYYFNYSLRYIQTNITKEFLIQLLSFSLPIIPGALASIMLNMSDKVILYQFLDLSQLGIYSSAFVLSNTLIVVGYAFYKAYEPIVLNNINNSNLQPIIDSVVRYLFFIFISLFIILSFFSKEIFKYLTSKDYQNASFLIPILLLGTFFNSFNLLNSTILIGQKRTKLVSFYQILVLIFYFFVCNYFTANFSLKGAAYSYSLAFALLYFLNQISIRPFRILSFSQLFQIISLFVFFQLFLHLDFDISFFMFVIKSFITIISIFLLSKLHNIQMHNFFKINH